LPIEQTLTRRELRALLQAEEQANTTAQETAAQNSAANPAGMTETTLQSPAPYQPYEPPAQHQPQPEPPAQPSAPVFQAPPAPLEAPPTPDSYQTNVLPEVVLPPVAPEPSTNTGLTNALAEFDALSASVSAAATQTSVVSRPVGHWATQLDLEDDDSDVPETTINRKIGSGHTATSALVLGSIPMGDIRGALTGSGEIMLTGSIDLPRNLSSTGASDRIDHEGMDAMFEQHDAEAHSTDSVPVRAISAVSTHTSGHGVTHTKKPKGTKHLTALLISASAMAVVAVGLLIAAFAFNVF
jgi:hypothetical protein